MKKLVAGNIAMALAISFSLMILFARGDSLVDFLLWVATFFVIVFVILSLISIALHFYRSVESKS